MEKSEMVIGRDVQLCHGCRMCEIMCSFHHDRVVSPERSSIHVIRDNANGRIQWSVDATCDLCRGEATIFCVKYCPYGALKREEK